MIPHLLNLDDKSNVKQIFDINNNFTHYHSVGGCGLSQSPCTHFDVNVIKNEILGYKIFIASEKR